MAKDLTSILAVIAATEQLKQEREMDAVRFTKGIALVLKGKVKLRRGVGWICRSESHPRGFYRVDPDDAKCDCPDATHRGSYCKHLIAVWIAKRARAILIQARRVQASLTATT